jgi:hypothetical protein
MFLKDEGSKIHCYSQGYFCDGTHWNAIPEVLSQKDPSQNGVLELFSLTLI